LPTQRLRKRTPGSEMNVLSRPGWSTQSLKSQQGQATTPWLNANTQKFKNQDQPTADASVV
jgi:hypothetical protein